jgi:hypothetical protein
MHAEYVRGEFTSDPIDTGGYIFLRRGFPHGDVLAARTPHERSEQGVRFGPELRNCRHEADMERLRIGHHMSGRRFPVKRTCLFRGLSHCSIEPIQWILYVLARAAANDREVQHRGELLIRHGSNALAPAGKSPAGQSLEDAAMQSSKKVRSESLHRLRRQRGADCRSRGCTRARQS